MIYSHIGGTRDTLVTTFLNYPQIEIIQRYLRFTHFPITVAHAPGFPVFTSRLLATDLNTETSTVSLDHTLPISLYYRTHKFF
jgi:hypothetical protein